MCRETIAEAVFAHRREDGFHLDRLLLTTDTTFIPSSFGPAESETSSGGLPLLGDRVIDYDYDDLYRLTAADYTSGELYEYDYDPVGNRWICRLPHPP